MKTFLLSSLIAAPVLALGYACIGSPTGASRSDRYFAC